MDIRLIPVQRASIREQNYGILTIVHWFTNRIQSSKPVCFFFDYACLTPDDFRWLRTTSKALCLDCWVSNFFPDQRASIWDQNNENLMIIHWFTKKIRNSFIKDSFIENNTEEDSLVRESGLANGFFQWILKINLPMSPRTFNCSIQAATLGYEPLELIFDCDLLNNLILGPMFLFSFWRIVLQIGRAFRNRFVQEHERSSPEN